MEIYIDGPSSALESMQIDLAIVQKGRKESLIRFYEWEKFCITYGLFVDPDRFVDRSLCQKKGVEVARRPTGGGLLFHEKDFCFSLFFPTGSDIATMPIEESSARINQAICSALQIEQGNVLFDERCQLCMAQPTPYDIIHRGYKIGGCAQRKTKHGLLHQVSLFVEEPNWEKIGSVLIDQKDLLVMQERTKSIKEWSRKELQKNLINAIGGIENG